MFDRPDDGAIASGAGAQNASSTNLRDAARTRPLLLCLSHLRWNFVWQRPQHLLSRAARDYDVLIVEEPIFETNIASHWDVTERAGQVRVAVPMLPWGLSDPEEIAATRSLLGELLAKEGRRPRVAWYYTPLAMAFSDDLDADVVVYDNMDELSAFKGASPDMLAYEAALFGKASLVFTGGMSLYEAKRDRHPNVSAFPSSIDAAHFASARERGGQDPADQAAIPHPRLGFFGVIDERLDLELVAAVAARRPDWSVVMIGPIAKIDEGSLPKAPNIHWLGPKDYSELPAYLAGWDVGLMPFALNESTRFISPTKTPEFLAAGVPVVSTAIRDVVRPYGEAGLVAIAKTAHEFVTLAEEAMARPRELWLRDVDRHLANGSWDETWSKMNGLIKDAALKH